MGTPFNSVRGDLSVIRWPTRANLHSTAPCRPAAGRTVRRELPAWRHVSHPLGCRRLTSNKRYPSQGLAGNPLIDTKLRHAWNAAGAVVQCPKPRITSIVTTRCSLYVLSDASAATISQPFSCPASRRWCDRGYVDHGALSILPEEGALLGRGSGQGAGCEPPPTHAAVSLFSVQDNRLGRQLARSRAQRSARLDGAQAHQTDCSLDMAR